MRITLGLILVLSLPGLFFIEMLVWRPSVIAQIRRPTPTPTPRPRPPRPTPTPRPTPNVERAVWNTIKNSNNPAVFDNFLRNYPNGRFAAAARARRDKLRRPEPTLLPPLNLDPLIEDSPKILAVFGFITVQLDRNGKELVRPLKVAPYLTEDLGNGVKLEMVEIPGGSFTMGSPTGEANRSRDEGPQHSVNVPSFLMGKFEVTQAQWLAVTGEFSNGRGFYGDDLPVERVSWDDIQEFLKKLNALPNLKGKNYRLPTEAEWEYAARAGTTTPFAFGETITPQIVNYDGNFPYANAAKGTYRAKTVPVGSLGVANAFGLFDMHGNVWEWCQDVYHDSYNGAPSNGSAWMSGGHSGLRVLRGGSWNYSGSDCRSALRYRDSPGYFNSYIGFRVVCART